MNFTYIRLEDTALAIQTLETALKKNNPQEPAAPQRSGIAVYITGVYKLLPKALVTA